MGKLLVSLSQALEDKIRNVVEKEYGGKRGAISIIVEKAVEKYLEEKP